MAKKTKQTKPEYTITVMEAAKILDKHPGTLANWRVRGVGPAYQKSGVGRGCRVLYNRDDLREFAKTMRRSISRR